MALDGLFCADVPLRNCSLTHFDQSLTKLHVLRPNFRSAKVKSKSKVT